MQTKERIENVFRQILEGGELRLRVDRLQIESRRETHQTTIECDLHDLRTGARSTVKGTGTGMVSAFFQGFIDAYGGDFPSLRGLRFAHLKLTAGANKTASPSPADVVCHVLLSVRNARGNEHHFDVQAASILDASVGAVVQAVEFFINAERAYVAVYRALQHAEAAGRSDSVARYTAQLATLVEATSYTEVIESLKTR